MDNKELACLFTGYGYMPRFVEDLENIDSDMRASLEWAYQLIREIQNAARRGTPITKPRWPVLILRSPKGWGCPKIVHGDIVEGSFRSHQVPLPAAKTDPVELESLQNWLRSYNPRELFTSGGDISEEIARILPKDRNKLLGQNPVAYDNHTPLHVPEWQDFAVQKGTEASCMSTAGIFLDEVMVQNPHSMRVFSPDELVSNKLSAIFRHTSRNFQWDKYAMGEGGQVTEILSEHTCQGKKSLLFGFVKSLTSADSH